MSTPETHIKQATQALNNAHESLTTADHSISYVTTLQHIRMSLDLLKTAQRQVFYAIEAIESLITGTESDDNHLDR